MGSHKDTFKIRLKNTLSYDNAPCGWRENARQAGEADTGGRRVIKNLTPHECFIPTISALALNTIYSIHDEEDLFYDVTNHRDIYSRTPFHGIYFPTENQEYMKINTKNMNWFECEIFAKTYSELVNSSCYEGQTIFE